MFNLEEFMNKEFLRHRENSCKWFNGLGGGRRWVYIVREGKCKISYKNNYMNRFTKCVNRFRLINDKAGKKKNGMKIDTHQEIFESIQNPQDGDWYDSDQNESIQWKSESFHDTFQF